MNVVPERLDVNKLVAILLTVSRALFINAPFVGLLTIFDKTLVRGSMIPLSIGFWELSESARRLACCICILSASPESPLLNAWAIWVIQWNNWRILLSVSVRIRSTPINNNNLSVYVLFCEWSLSFLEEFSCRYYRLDKHTADYVEIQITQAFQHFGQCIQKPTDRITVAFIIIVTWTTTCIPPIIIIIGISIHIIIIVIDVNVAIVVRDTRTCRTGWNS